jgi:hypothetical protein
MYAYGRERKSTTMTTNPTTIVIPLIDDHRLTRRGVPWGTFNQRPPDALGAPGLGLSTSAVTNRLMIAPEPHCWSG